MKKIYRCDKNLKREFNFADEFREMVINQIGIYCPVCFRLWKIKYENFSMTFFCDHKDGYLDIFIPPCEDD